MSEKRIIIALDFASAREALTLVDQLDPQVCRVKIGNELFTATGPSLIRDIAARKFDVFLDLKFHDIPTTVARAVSAAADLGVWMMNVHAAGGQIMMEQASEALAGFGDSRPLLIAVTVLTSMAEGDLGDVGINCKPQEWVQRLATLANAAGLDGVVCSAAETSMLRASLPAEFCLVTPGIRRAEDTVGDQKRVVGPAEAIANGSDYLVVGRPITRANSPLEALEAFNTAVAGVS
ncbi:MAG: orotidine-5'-phosphate decarboxylase [Gammaproteobacteria bacterium]|jgi:orotidine-5'-phosphate decarboxylase|nr:orotidine-5'-phosphate decarboxylase [Gammaproteobacteria bacterium]MDP6096329.1 orotidine-5'-phosphate decarboxylase [Gammaproteobacteria bacterium]MDP7455450.1 orotidine-5'-phosphate decarboxylase [Gammaproteobacteria bacterium]HJO10712.1 orotidine-5'-phosphate decarboxylase [Gammaproteobacteria bacterium]